MWVLTLSDTAPSPPSDVVAVQASLTSITVTWTASSNATGYRVHYTSDRDRGSETVSDGSTETHTLTGLVNGETYTISVAATSEHFPSEAVAANTTVSLRKCILPSSILIITMYISNPAPGQPVVISIINTATSIFLSWIVPVGSVVSSYEVKWSSDQCLGHEMESSATTTDNSTSYTILNLRPGTNYTLFVTATNSAGDSSSETATVETEEESELILTELSIEIVEI